MDPLIVAVAGSSALSLASIVVAVYRRRTVVTSQLQVELDLAVEQNKRLAIELQKVEDRLHAAIVKASSPELLSKWADMATQYAESQGGTPTEKRKAAVKMMETLDRGDNGVTDFTGAQYRVAIEHALAKPPIG